MGETEAFPNVFDNLNAGILYSGSLTLTNCRFANIKSPPSPLPFQGAAVARATGGTWSNLTLTGLGQNNGTATFNDCDMAVYARGGLSVSECNMTGINNAAIVCSDARYRDVVIRDNAIHSNHNGIVLPMNDGAESVQVFNNDLVIGEYDSIAGTDNAGIVAANFSNGDKSGINIHD